MKIFFVFFFMLSLSQAFATVAPDKFQVLFKTTKGEFVVAVDKKDAPLGAQRFYDLVQEKYFDQNKFFRVVKGFVVQFGISANPATSLKWKEKNLQDDPVLLSNAEGVITFATAGKNTRTTQLFINLANNSMLDRMGFAGFGKIEKGMDVVKNLNGEYGEDPTPMQGRIYQEGNAFLEKSFPKLDGIISATLVSTPKASETKSLKKK